METRNVVKENWEQFKVWRDSVVRLAKHDRFRNDLEATMQRIIKRAIDSAVCDCYTCVRRIVEEDKSTRWPNCASEKGGK